MVKFKIATYNVNSIRSRLHIVIPWLRENRPDVLCMQETKVRDSHFPLESFVAEGYHVLYRGESAYNGVAIASLERPQDVQIGFDDGEPADSDRLMIARFSGITVINTYVPQGRERESVHYVYKLQWFKRLQNIFAEYFKPSDSLIWCGDLNVAPEEFDVHDPKRLMGHVCFNPEVWKAFGDMKSWGLTDIFRKHHPGEKGCYTFFDYRVAKSVERGLGWRVDHILATDPLVKRSVACTIDIHPRKMEKPSDHTVLYAEFIMP